MQDITDHVMSRLDIRKELAETVVEVTQNKSALGWAVPDIVDWFTEHVGADVPPGVVHEIRYADTPAR